MCAKDGVWQSCVRKMVCDKVVYERWAVKDCMSLHTLHSTLHTSYSILHTPHSTLSTPHSTLYTLHLTLLYTLHSALYTLHSALYTLHFTLYTLHSSLHTLHFTLHTPPTTVYTLHCPPPTVMILSPLVNRLLETQTICSTFGRLLLALQPFAPPSSVSLLIPLQTILFRTPTDAALRWASEFLHVPPCSSIFPLLWMIFLHFLSFFSYLFPVIPPFSPFSPVILKKQQILFPISSCSWYIGFVSCPHAKDWSLPLKK